MNSLTWLLTPRLRPPSRDRSSTSDRARPSASHSDPNSAPSMGKDNAKVSFGQGPREAEAESVDEVLGKVEQTEGAAAANRLEWKASMGRDGTLRLGVPGVVERRRQRALGLALDGEEGASDDEGGAEEFAFQRAREEPRRWEHQGGDSEGALMLSEAGKGDERSREDRQDQPRPRPGTATYSPPPPPSHFPIDELLPSLPSTAAAPPSPSIKASSPLSSASPPLTPSHLLSRRLSRPSPSGFPSRRSRIFARSFPVRIGVRIYILIRRFLSLFGLRLPPSRTEADAIALKSGPTPIDEKSSLLSSPVSSAKSKAHATDVSSDNERFLPPPVESTSHDSPATPPNQFLSFLRQRLPSLSTPLPTLDLPDPFAGRRARTLSDASVSSDAGSESDSSLSPSSPSGRKSLFLSPSGPPLSSSTSAQTSAEALLSRRPKTLVLDLDETLIHSTSRLGGMGGVAGGLGGGGNAGAGLKVRVVEVVLDGRIVVYHVYKRPWVDFFLKKVSSWYTVVIFTASMREYADPVIDWLDAGRGIIGGRLFRESCTSIGGSYVKNLAIVDPDLSKVCLVDNSPISYGLNQANGIPIEGWLNDPHDEGLLDLLPMLDSLRFTSDVRRILGLRGFGSTQSPGKRR